jgi:hypothetical protein
MRAVRAAPLLAFANRSGKRTAKSTDKTGVNPNRLWHYEGSVIPTGGFALMQPKTHHFAYTTTEAVELQLHGIGPWGVAYINAADDPRKKQP